MVVGRSFAGHAPLRQRRSAHTQVLSGFSGSKPIEFLENHSVYLGYRDSVGAKEGEAVPLECQVIQWDDFSSPPLAMGDRRNADAHQKAFIEHVVP
jgi:hypothetical protein